MNNIREGGPAFPVPYHPGQQRENPSGMTLLDYFAAKAMQSMILVAPYSPEHMSNAAEHTAEWAYKFAAAMLSERKKHESEASA